MPVGAAIGGIVGGIGGAAISANASKNAAQTQAQAANQAAQTQMQIYQQTRSDLAPFLNFGQSATAQLASILGLPMSTPLAGAAAPGGTYSAGPYSAVPVSGYGGATSPLAAYAAGLPSSATVGNASVPISATDPGVHTSGARWIDTSSGVPTLKVWDASEGRYGIPNAQQQSGWLGGSPLSAVLQQAAQQQQQTASADQSANLQKMLENYPGYQFQLNQGVQALDRSAASRGLLLSGGQLKDVTQFGQGMAASQWNDFLNRLTGLSQLGENAGAQTGSFGTTTGAGVAGSQLAAGQATAAGQVGQANAITSGINNSLNLALQGYGMFGGGAGAPMTYSGGSYVNPVGGGMLNNQIPTGQFFSVSDRRAKRDIRRVGQLDDGTNVYAYRLMGRPETQLGVMAQEIERTKPRAVKTLPSGLKVVDYQEVVSPLAALAKAA